MNCMQNLLAPRWNTDKGGWSEMNGDTRAMIAYIAGNLICDGRPTRIYDRSREIFLVPGFDLVMPRISLHTSQLACNVKRPAKGTSFCLIDRTDHHICLHISGRQFEGFDHGSRSHFSGRVLEGYVSLFDYRVSDYFSYQI